MAERIPVLVVTDPEQSAEFCTDVLGMRLVSGEPEWVFGLGNEKLRLISAARVDLELGQAAEAGSTACRIMATNIGLLHERCELHDVVVKKRHLRRTRWGTDEFTVEDPEGNRITFWTVSVT
ncbi:VOC family protein [Granulicoccus sp. GXG6511]|uniref:VOC family protein n=1 Tax=Granulicoccus sp. GXG6511 TaxID=3381351 RepID=UPI003D7C91A5